MTEICCPRCSKPCSTRVRYLTTGIAGGAGVGLVWLLALPFLQHRYCPDHGKIPLEEFTDADRRRMWWRTAIQLVLVIAFLAAAISLVVMLLK